jgi:lipopolysaccharide biosynthesis glycosyltransferase
MKVALCLACDDNFIPYTAVAARRIACYATEKFPIIVVSDGVSDENKTLARKFCPRIAFIEAGHLFDGRILPVSRNNTRAAILRLFLDEILSDFDRAVYLDSDISPMTDVSPLLSMAPKAAPVIAGYDLTGPPTLENTVRLGMSDGAAYFNSGVAVYDLKAVRDELIFADALKFAQENPDRCRYVDQDSLNVVLDGRWQVLDWRWNALNHISNRLPKQPFIRHFAGNTPWSRSKVGVESRFVGEWRSDLAESPWPGRFHEQSLRYRLRKAFRPATSGLEHLAKSLIHRRSPGPAGAKLRFLRNQTRMLAFIEEAAAAGALASPLLRFGGL